MCQISIECNRFELETFCADDVSTFLTLATRCAEPVFISEEQILRRGQGRLQCFFLTLENNIFVCFGDYSCFLSVADLVTKRVKSDLMRFTESCFEFVGRVFLDFNVDDQVIKVFDVRSEIYGLSI